MKLTDLKRQLTTLKHSKGRRRRSSASLMADTDFAPASLTAPTPNASSSSSSSKHGAGATPLPTSPLPTRPNSPVSRPDSPIGSSSSPAGTPGLPFPSATRIVSKGSYTGSRRGRRKISISIVPDARGRRALVFRRRRDSLPSQTPSPRSRSVSTPGISKAKARPTSWVTVNGLDEMSHCQSPGTMTPRSVRFPPLDETSEESASTVLATPTSTLSPVVTRKSDSLLAATSKQQLAEATCLLERLCPPDALERKPSITKKPAPGRVYVFDVVSEEHPEPPSTQAPDPRTERQRLAKSAQRAPLAFRVSPWMRVVTDLVFLATHVTLLPRMFVPCRRHGSAAGGLPADATSGCTTQCRGHITDATVTQAFLLLLSVVVTILGFGSLLACMPTVLALLTLVFIAESIQGPKTRDSKRPDINPVPGAEREAWFFVNGLASTGSGTQEEIDYLHGLVHRPVTALMNRSLGLWFDFLQSIIQRGLFLPTRDVRNGYKYVHAAVMNPALDRIVLVAHSQGGIIVSAWVDQFVADLPPQLLTRVEVYTFGSAASHFALRADGEGAFARVEHFANMHDMVAQFGVLQHARGGAYAPPRPGCELEVGAVYGRYVGRVFARNRTGHMFLDHYLHPSDSILDEPSVKAASRLAGYVGGGNLLPPPFVPQRSASGPPPPAIVVPTVEPAPAEPVLPSRSCAAAPVYGKAASLAAAFATSVMADTRAKLGNGSPAKARR